MPGKTSIQENTKIILEEQGKQSKAIQSKMEETTKDTWGSQIKNKAPETKDYQNKTGRENI